VVDVDELDGKWPELMTRRGLNNLVSHAIA
jgi:hypothetical protein